MDREQQSRQGFVCESCGQGFDSLQLLDEHRWNNKYCSAQMSTPNQQTDRETMIEAIEKWRDTRISSGPFGPDHMDLADRLLSLGFTRAGSGVSGRIISEELRDGLIEIMELHQGLAYRNFAQQLRNAPKATPQPIALEGVDRIKELEAALDTLMKPLLTGARGLEIDRWAVYINAQRQLKEQPRRNGKWVRFSDLEHLIALPAAVKKEGDHE